MTPPGFQLFPDVVSEDDERALVALGETLELAPFVMRGQASKRLIFSFGVDYGGYRLRAGPPLPAILRDLRARVTPLAGVGEDDLVQAMITRYPPGAGIGWHRDFPAFGATIVGVSLAAPCRMRLRREREIVTIELPPRSGYVLAGPARSEWEHSIPPVRTQRWSVTFRMLARPRVLDSPAHA